MLVKLASGHVLVFFSITDITSKFRTVKLGMSLQLVQSLPHYLSSTITCEAFVWEFAKVNAVFQYFVHFLHELTTISAIRAAKVLTLWSNSIVLICSTSSDCFLFHLVYKPTNAHLELLWVQDGFIFWQDLTELELAILAEQLVAFAALKRFVWELEADDALDLLYHLALKLVLNLIHLDIERRNRFWPHHSLHSSMSSFKIKSLIDRKGFFFSIHLFEEGLHFTLLSVHLLYRHYERYIRY